MILKIKFYLKLLEKTRQNVGNKKTFDLTAKIELEGKSCQNVENKQTFDVTAKIEIEGKSRQNTENKQTFDLTRNGEKLMLRKNLVKTLKINKLLI